MINLFEQVGLFTNETKTKYMVFRGPTPPKQICEEAYIRQTTGRGKLTTNEERKKHNVVYVAK